MFKSKTLDYSHSEMVGGPLAPGPPLGWLVHKGLGVWASGARRIAPAGLCGDLRAHAQIGGASLGISSRDWFWAG